MKKQPNIIFFFVDQQRWDTAGCYGQPLDITPNLDKMAEEGTLFTNAYTCQPVCGPARACLQTGKYATEVGCFRNAISLPLDTKTIAPSFKAAGYDTAYIGKWHLASDNDKNHYETTAVPKERRGGYDYWMAADVLEFTSHGYDGYVFDTDNNKVEFKGYRADCITDFALDYIKNHDDTKPFFLFLSHIEPHHQNDHHCYEGPNGSKEKYKDFVIPGDLEGTGGNWRTEYPDYLGCCNRLDYNLGRVRELLKEKGIEDNTVIIYTSDHGSHFCTRNSEYKRACHDGCTHIPLVAYGKGFTGGKVIDDMVSLIDVPKTFFDCADIEPFDGMQGDSLLALAEGRIENPKDTIFMQISESQVGRAIRTKEWKYSVRAVGDGDEVSCSDVYYEDFLYHLTNDPHERVNLVDAPEYENVRAQLAEKLKEEMKKANEKVPQILPYSARPENF